MNPRERILRTLRGQKADRVPLVLPGFICRSRADLGKIGDPLRRKIAGRIIDETDFRVQVPCHINRMLVTPPQRIRTEHRNLPNGNRRTFGMIDTPLGELTFVTEWSPHSQTGWQVKYPVEDEQDIKKIASVPWELPDKLLPPDTNSIPERFSERGILTTNISSPFVCVSGMMSYEWFLELCFLDLDLIKELTEICRQRVLDCVKMMLSRPGIEYVWMGGSEWVTPPMAPPMIYDALVQEQERSIIQCVHENSNAIVHIHCHGRVRDALPKTIERGGDYTEPVEPPPDGDITMVEAKEIAAGRITLGGNVECRVLCNESEDALEQAVRAAFEGGKERFILRPTEGPSPRLSQQEFNNYMRLIDVWEELSPLDKQ
jgi:uroporphyrinogen-III decarboxylase